MSNLILEKEFEQLKIDYLTFMEKINKSFGYDSNRHGILLTLILESRHLTQDEIEELTGFSKSVVSENLSHLTSIMSKYPVYETRKKGEKKKYFYTNLTFKDYSKINFLGSTESLQLNVDFLPEILYRIDQLDETDEILYTKSIFLFLLNISNFLSTFSDHARKNIEAIFEGKFTISFDSKTIKIIQEDKNFKINKHQFKKGQDSIFAIKKDFISRMQDFAHETGRKKELISILIALFLNPEPLNQDELIKLTNHSRSIISEGLKLLVKVGSVKIVKKPNDRKNYYITRAKLQDFGLQGYENRKILYKKTCETIENSFITTLKTLKIASTKKDTLNTFFNENIIYFQILENYLTKFYEYFYKEGHLQDY
jgi:DNA-binding transcriptional regulator GbsR (MarR family)